MATKQGLSGQISQVSEDAKRAVLQKTSLTNSLWFSNLNTTCTIKSAPPRTPDVLGLLSVKSGWLLKRNEQHVWQPRYCCVVPHTFLYYFDAHPTSQCEVPNLTPKQQDFLNKAVRQGYGKRGALKHQQPRSSLYHVLGTGASATVPPPADENQEGTTSTLQPAGIIDLECYTTVHRNSQNQNLLELAGDDSVNPDLRSFYFCTHNSEEGEEWSQALLGQRHAALQDEKEAYRQVCDGFAQQLQELHTELDSAQKKADSHRDEMYRVRSQMEEIRRSCLRMVKDAMDQNEGTIAIKKAYKADLETIQGQDLGIQAAVQLLCDYTRVLEETVRDNADNVNELKKQQEQKQEGDQSKVEQLESELDELKREMQKQQMGYQTQIDTLQAKYIQAQKECQDVQKDLASQKMEVTMFQSSTRTKVTELQTHKKILKKEVIELRKKVEEANSELDLYKHKESGAKLEAEQERQKAKLLERYVEKVESQVKVQQNMMEMMSQAGSVYGGSVAFDPNAATSPPKQVGRPSSTSGKPFNREYGNLIVNTPSSVQHDEDEEANDYEGDDQQGYQLPFSNNKRSASRGRGQVKDDDEKSHMSELTEDRTQRQFDAVLMLQQQAALRAIAASSSSARDPARPSQPNYQLNGPPAMIGVSDEGDGQGENKAPKLDTISSIQPASRRSSGAPRKDIPRYEAKSVMTRNTSDGGSTSSLGSKSKLSVAQRARLEAEMRGSTPVRIRLNQATGSTTPTRGNAAGRKDSPQNMSSNQSASGSFFSNLGRRLEDGLDNIMFGEDERSYQSTDVGTDIGTDVMEEKKTDASQQQAGVATAAKTKGLTLAERQQLQRERQLKFLKHQGLINDEKEVRGGASVSSNIQ
eukprot:scaffold1184_cov132-Cylindrotheca_fusiformis.AAC.40